MNPAFRKPWRTGRAHLKAGWTITCLRSLVCGRWSLIFADVHGLPFALNDSRAGLCGSFSFLGLFVGMKILADAGLATGAMLANEAIKKTFVALAAIAMAIARLLVENFFRVGREGVGILHY